MTRPLFLLAALLSFFGTFGHSYLGERDIFPKLHASSTGLNPAAIRILRVTWHTASLSFATLGSILTLLGCKSGLLSRDERWIVGGISVWYALTGVGCIKYWDRKRAQGWVFLAICGMLQLGLMLTPWVGLCRDEFIVIGIGVGIGVRDWSLDGVWGFGLGWIHILYSVVETGILEFIWRLNGSLFRR